MSCSACGKAWADGQVFLGTPHDPDADVSEIVWRRWWVCSIECTFEIGAGRAGGAGERVTIEGPRMSIGGLRMTISPALAETADGRLVTKDAGGSSRCTGEVDGGRCAGLLGHEGDHYANARDRDAGGER